MMIRMHELVQFITEKFYGGVDTTSGYAEIYLNPTRDELTSAFGNADRRQFAGILDAPAKKLYVWDRDMATHAQVRHRVPVTDVDWVPLYLKLDDDGPTVSVEISEYTMIDTKRSSYTLANYRDRLERSPLTKLGRLHFEDADD